MQARLRKYKTIIFLQFKFLKKFRQNVSFFFFDDFLEKFLFKFFGEGGRDTYFDG